MIAAPHYESTHYDKPAGPYVDQFADTQVITPWPEKKGKEQKDEVVEQNRDEATLFYPEHPGEEPNGETEKPRVEAEHLPCRRLQRQHSILACPCHPGEQPPELIAVDTPRAATITEDGYTNLLEDEIEQNGDDYVECLDDYSDRHGHVASYLSRMAEEAKRRRITGDNDSQLRY